MTQEATMMMYSLLQRASEDLDEEVARIREELKKRKS